jgi:hypothetical protein
MFPELAVLPFSDENTVRIQLGPLEGADPSPWTPYDN